MSGVPVEGIVPAELVDLLYRANGKRRQRILRSVYECGVFQALREKLRCKEIWVVGVIEEEHSVKLFPGRRARINPVGGGLFICQELHRHVPKDTPDLPGIS